jgi:hypothetical protein
MKLPARIMKVNLSNGKLNSEHWALSNENNITIYKAKKIAGPALILKEPSWHEGPRHEEAPERGSREGKGMAA